MRGVNTKANGIDFRANRFDEFLKLIPQNLTDAEKAQVMANLGITPTPGSLDGAVRYDAAQTLTDEQKQQVQENAGVDEALAEKANIDGYYSQLTAGAAENLVGGNETSREFIRDTAGGTADIADGIVQIEKIKGNTIVWNQIFGYFATQTKLGVQITNNNDGTFTLNGTANGNGEVFGIVSPNVGSSVGRYSKYIVKVNVNKGESTSISARKGVLLGYTTEGINVSKTIYKQTEDFSDFVMIKFEEGDVYDNVTYRVQMFDLTKMFGAGNEPATVAEFEKMFPLDYYDYVKGEILSLNPTGIKTVGFNAYNPTTGKASVIGGKQYQITGAYTSIAEDDTTITPDEDGLFSPTHNGELTIAGGNSTTTCVHLVWSGVRDGEFEEHWEETRNLPVANINTDGTITESATGKTRLFPDGLCSAGSVNDEVTPTKAIKRIGKIDLGSLNWNKTTSGTIYFFADVNGAPYREYNGIAAFSYKKSSNLSNDKEYRCYGASSTYSYSRIGITDSSYSTTADFKAAMSGVYLYYELATPIEVTFSEPLNLTYRVSDFGTETLFPINTATPVTTPIRLDVVYGLNVVDFVRNADKNYLTIEDSTGDNGSSFTNLRSALSTAFGIDIVPTYNATNKRYTFVITDNRKVEVPASATASGKAGTWAEDDTAVYFCTDANSWVKINKETL